MTAWIAVAVFVAAYVFIATEWVHKTLVALVGAGLVLALGIVGSTRSSTRTRPGSTGTSSSCCSA